MRTSSLIGLLVATGVVGCASAPMPDAALETARTAVTSTAADPNVARYSALDLQAARNELALAETAARQRDAAAVEQPAYLATQTARLAELRATARADDARVAAGQSERERIELSARDREVTDANRANEAAAAKAAALKAQLEALKAQRAQ